MYCFPFSPALDEKHVSTCILMHSTGVFVLANWASVFVPVDFQVVLRLRLGGHKLLSELMLFLS